jgi:hypothetical protein
MFGESMEFVDDKHQGDGVIVTPTRYNTRGYSTNGACSGGKVGSVGDAGSTYYMRYGGLD